MQTKFLNRRLVWLLLVLLLSPVSQAWAGPAPALSSLEVRYVGSSNQGWEPIAASQLLTTRDHGGPQLRALTVEGGYGRTPIAFMNGVRLPSAARYLSEPICDASNFLAACRAGQTVIGWRHYWNLDGYQSGRFSSQNTSIVFPFRTLTDAVNIR